MTNTRKRERERRECERESERESFLGFEIVSFDVANTIRLIYIIMHVVQRKHLNIYYSEAFSPELLIAENG